MNEMPAVPSTPSERADERPLDGMEAARIAGPRVSEATEQFRRVLDALPAAVYMTDAEGRITYFNQAAVDLSGQKPILGSNKWCITWRLYNADGTPLPHDQCPMAVALKEGRPVRSVEIIAERPDGTRVPVMPFPTPVRDDCGRLIGAVNMLVEISALKRAEEEASRRLAEQATLFEFTDRLYRAESLIDIYDAAVEAILTALRCQRASILLFDESGVMRFVAWRRLSAAYRQAVEGHSPWTADTRDPQPICIEDIDGADLAEDLKATVRREGIRALAFILLVAQGKLIGKFMAYYDAPHVFGRAGVELGVTVARQLGFGIERLRAEQARRRAENELREQLDLTRAITDNAATAIFMMDEHSRCTFMNPAAERMTGFRFEEVAAGILHDFIHHHHPDGRPYPMPECPIDRALPEQFEVADHEDVFIRKSGEFFPVLVNARPIRRQEARAGTVIEVRDLTEHKRAEQQRTLLMHELNHRVKNTLATVQALAMQTLRNTERSSEARDLLNSRLAALARAHDVLTAESWDGAGLREIVLRALDPFGTGAARITAEGPEVRLSPKQALALSMALHELATNAAKYGALSNDAGHVRVEWSLARRNGTGTIELIWTEHGGPPVLPPTKKGFGSRMIGDHLATELGGQVSIEFRPEGVVCAMKSPAAAGYTEGISK